MKSNGLFLLKTRKGYKVMGERKIIEYMKHVMLNLPSWIKVEQKLLLEKNPTNEK